MRADYKIYNKSAYEDAVKCKKIDSRQMEGAFIFLSLSMIIK